MATHHSLIARILPHTAAETVPVPQRSGPGNLARSARPLGYRHVFLLLAPEAPHD